MKCDLTRKIEDKLARWQPTKIGDLEISYYRKQYMDFEVPVTHGTITSGIVDCVWCAEGFNNKSEYFCCNYKKAFENSYPLLKTYKCNLEHEERLEVAECIGDYKCRFRHKVISKNNARYVICFEIKISVEDFCSKNGHNFVGNLNYYVVPKQLVNNIKDKVPEGIGIFAYEETSDKLFKIKDSQYRTITEADYNWFLLSIINKQTKRNEKELKDLRNEIHKLKYDKWVVKSILAEAIKNQTLDKDIRKITRLLE